MSLKSICNPSLFLFNFIFVVFWYYSIFVFVVAGGWGTTFICWRLDGSVLVGEFLTRATTTNTPEFDADISIFAKIFLWKSKCNIRMRIALVMLMSLVFEESGRLRKKHLLYPTIKVYHQAHILHSTLDLINFLW